MTAASCPPLHPHRTFNAFSADLQVPEFPNYVVVEPNSGLLSAADGNDMHPSHDVRNGEALIASIYTRSVTATTGRRACSSSSSTSTADSTTTCRRRTGRPTRSRPTTSCRRTRRSGLIASGCGYRACLLCRRGSPTRTWIRANFDHSSLPATLKKLFGLPSFLGKRDSAANTFESLLLDEMREHTLPSDETRPLAMGGGSAAIDLTLSEHQRALLAMAGSAAAPRPIRAQAEQAIAARRAVYGQTAAAAARR